MRSLVFSLFSSHTCRWPFYWSSLGQMIKINGALYGLKGTQPNTLCSGFLPKPSHGNFGQFFPTCTYTGIGTSVSSLKHLIKSTTKKLHFLSFFFLIICIIGNSQQHLSTTLKLVLFFNHPLSSFKWETKWDKQKLFWG